jgi:hypothetical protein
MGDYWTLEEALELIRGLQSKTRDFNYHLCLGGGVLNTGESKKDLDLFFLPLDNGKQSLPDWLLTYLETLWGKSEDLIKSNPAYEAETPAVEPSVCRHKKKFTFDGLRIDVFILGPSERKELQV